MRDKLHATAVISPHFHTSVNYCVPTVKAFGSVCLKYCRQKAFESVGRFGSASLQMQNDDCDQGTAVNRL